MGRPSYTETRRRRLARRVEALERLEGRNSVGDLSSPLGMAYATLAGSGLAMVVSGARAAHQAAGVTRAPVTPASAPAALRMIPAPEGPSARPFRRVAGGFAAGRAAIAEPATGDDWLRIATPRPATPTTNPSPTPASSTAAGGGSAGQSGGGSVAGAARARGAITPLRIPAPGATDSGASGQVAALAAAAAGGSAVVSTADVSGGGTGSGGTRFDDPDSGGGLPSGGDFLLAAGGGELIVPGADTDVALGIFDNFVLHTLDYQHGTVLFPGAVQYGALADTVDLRAQVRDDVASAYTFSWDTSGLGGDATLLAGTGTTDYRLQFKWIADHPIAAVRSVTLTATQSTTGLTEVQTYSFYLPTGSVSGSGGGTTATWPEALGPDLLLAGSPAFGSHDVAVDANRGALDAAIMLPSYSPNLAPLVLTYDSTVADARPIVVEHHALDDSLTTPTKTSAKLTFNGTAGSTYYYDTAKFIPGDIQQIALQANATAPATGRYAYSVTVADVRGTTTTTTVAGDLAVLNGGSNEFGAGWTLAGLSRAYELTGGVLIDLGLRGRSLWFASSGSSYTAPAGEFSTLVKNGDGSFTRTLADGTTQEFRASDGRQVAAVDRDGLRVTYGYFVSGQLKTVADPYAQVTTFAYAAGKLATITDPAGRVTTVTVSSGVLTAATLPDGASWGFAYDASKRLTTVTDPRTHRVTVAYDGAGRVGTITRPDLTTETVAPYQKAGFGTSTTAGSPGPALLLAEAKATHTDPNGNAQDLRPDWRGQGLTNQGTDALGYVATLDRDANGLATVAVDRVNRLVTYGYDAQGNATKVSYLDGNSETYTYNGFSQVTESQNARGFRTTFTYDSEGHLTGVRDAQNNRTTLTYTANGRLATAQDARGNTTSLAYDSQDRLATVTHPGGSTSKRAYDAKGNVATSTNERNFSTTYAYDALNRQTGQTDALTNRTTFTYDSGGNLTVVDAPLSRTTTLAYDSLNRLTTVTAPLSRVTAFGYDAGGRRSTTTDPLSRTTTVAYDALDRVAVVIAPLVAATTRRTTFTYNAEGQVATVADPLNRITTTTYNSRGWAATVADPAGNVATYGYSATGKLDSWTDYATSGGSGTAYTYDELDRLVEVRDPLLHRVTTVYDAVGNVVARADGNNNRTTFAYDARDRMTTVTDPLSHATVFGYDDAGNRATVTDPLGHVTTTAFDALDRATTLTDARGGVTAFGFDAAGRRTTVVDPAGNRTTFSYDAADRVTTVTDALGTATMAYDDADQLTDRADRIGRRVTFAYDSGGRATVERWIYVSGTVARRITFTYDAADQLTGVADPDATLTFTYDSGGRQITARTAGSGTGQPDVTLTSGFDAAGRRTDLADNLASVGRTTYAYDAASRLTQADRTYGGTAGPRVDYAYDAADRLTTLTRTVGGSGTQVRSLYSFDNANRLGTIVHDKVVSGTATPLATFAYGYDNANRLATEANAEGTATFSYDDTDQVTGADRPGTSLDESYGYDLAGNRNTTGYTTTTGNRLTASPGATYTSNAEGNTTSRTDTSTGKVTTFTYDHRNRLTGATIKTSGGAITMQATYTYDAFGRRIAAEVDADGAGAGPAVKTWTAFDGENLYADFDGSGTLQKRYLYGPAIDALLARTDSGGTTAWYLSDKLGTVRDLVNTSGTVVDHIAYEGFGKVASETGPASGDRFKFTGRELNAETGDYYYRARHYSASTGRFTGRDPIGFAGGDVNLFRYAGNGPTNARDATGLDYGDGPHETQPGPPTQYYQPNQHHHQLLYPHYSPFSGRFEYYEARPGPPCPCWCIGPAQPTGPASTRPVTGPFPGAAPELTPAQENQNTANEYHSAELETRKGDGPEAGPGGAENGGGEAAGPGMGPGGVGHGGEPAHGGDLGGGLGGGGGGEQGGGEALGPDASYDEIFARVPLDLQSLFFAMLAAGENPLDALHNLGIR